MVKKKTIIEGTFLLCAVLAVIGGFFLAHKFGYTAYANEPAGKNAEHSMEIVVDAGDSVMNIAEQLEEEGMILSKEAFWFRSKFSKYDGLMKAGTYEINETMGTDDILAVITQSGAQ